jgi:hypothetical protein
MTESTNDTEPEAVRGFYVVGAFSFAVLVVVFSILLVVALLRSDGAGRAVLDPSRGRVKLDRSSIEDHAVGLELRARQRRELSRYGWVDREQGVVEIPIERAMELIVEESK